MCVDRLKSFEHQSERSSREYNMEKLVSLKQEVDELSRKFEECQDSYATEMFNFLRKEKEYTEHMQNVSHCWLSLCLAVCLSLSV